MIMNNVRKLAWLGIYRMPQSRPGDIQDGNCHDVKPSLQTRGDEVSSRFIIANKLAGFFLKIHSVRLCCR